MRIEITHPLQEFKGGDHSSAVFMDRDGIINELVYYPEHAVVDSPFTVEQFRLTPFAAQAVNRFHDLGYKVIVISNQPGMAKGHFNESTFDLIRIRMRDMLKKENANLDGEYYCFHHPNGIREEYKGVCDCRKPKPGLILRAAKDQGIRLSESFFIGDGLVDMKAGRAASCTTILVASANAFLIKLMKDQDSEPDYLVRTLGEAVSIVENHKTARRQHHPRNVSEGR